MFCERLRVGPYLLKCHTDWLLIGTCHGVRQDQTCVGLAQLSCRHVTLEVQVEGVWADRDPTAQPSSGQAAVGRYGSQVDICDDGARLRVEPGRHLLLSVDPGRGDCVKAPQKLAD